MFKMNLKSAQKLSKENWNYLNLKFPILFDNKNKTYAIFFNNSEDIELINQSFTEKKVNAKLLQTFDNVKDCSIYWDKVTIDYFGGGY